jgi:hypothetical protein
MDVMGLAEMLEDLQRADLLALDRWIGDALSQEKKVALPGMNMCAVADHRELIGFLCRHASLGLATRQRSEGGVPVQLRRNLHDILPKES